MEVVQIQLNLEKQIKAVELKLDQLDSSAHSEQYKIFAYELLGLYRAYYKLFLKDNSL